MATIKQVAEKAGVSTATVSRLLNENGFISEDAKRKIKKAMKETGFDPAKRKRRVLTTAAIPGLTHNNVLMIWNTGQTHGEETVTAQNMMQGVTEALQPLGASLTVAHLNGDDAIPPSLEHGTVDGILIHGAPPSPAIANTLRKFPVVWLLKAGSADYGDRVQPDHTISGEIACDWLVKQGCRNLCCMGYNVKTTRHIYARTRANFFQRRAKHHGVDSTLLVEPEPIEPASLIAARAANAFRLVEKFVSLNPQPDGLFVAPEIGPQIHTELLKRGIIPMKDLPMVAGGEDVCIGYHLDPSPASIRIFATNIGKQAVEMLLQRIKNLDMPQITAALKPELVIPAEQ